MEWKSVACAACLLPVLAGCGSVRPLAIGARSTPSVSAFEYGQRSDASGAWATVQGQHPQRTFTDEFRDGFVAGYTDFLARGSAAAPPAVPPADYTHYKKYQTPEGDGLVRDYYLGFQYGVDVAAGKRRTGSLVAPLPTAEALADTVAGPGGNKFGGSKVKSAEDPAPEPARTDSATGAGRATPPLPKPELPIIPPFNPEMPGGGKFAPLPVPSDADRLPAPYPPLPIPSALVPLPVPPSESKGVQADPFNVPVVPVPVMKVTLPASSDAGHPTGSALPAILGDIPVIPFRLAPPAPPK